MKKLLAIITALLLTGCAGAGGKTEEPTVPEGFFDEPVTGKVTVYCFRPWNMQYLKKAERLFEETYPGTDVEIQAFQPMPGIKIGYNEDGTPFGLADEPDPDETRRIMNDYLSRINTEMMSGKGPDVIAADVISYYKYADNGMLLDMAPYMKADPGFNEEDYWASVINSSRYKGGQYIFPISFIFNYFAYDASLFTDEEIAKLAASDAFTIEQLIEIAKPAFDRNGSTYMFGLTADMQNASLYYRAIDANYGTFVDLAERKAYFDDGRFEVFLLSFKEYADAGYIKYSVPYNETVTWNLYADMTNETISAMTGIEINTLTERYFYKNLDMTALLQHFDKNSSTWMYYPGIGETENDVVAGMFAGDGGNVDVLPGNAYCINEASANKRAAWEFIKLLAGEQMQTELELWVPPVNVKAFEKVTIWKLTGNSQKRTDASLEIPADKQEAYDNYMACIEKLTSLINSCQMRDSIIDQMIEEEVAHFFDGTKSAGDAARTLQNKVNLYLSE